MNKSLPDVYLARHGETAWSLLGRHTGLSDIPLTERGEDNARRLRGRLEGITFTGVLVSPLQRARRTCELAGFAAVAKVSPDLVEWDYGDYEGQLTSDVRRERQAGISSGTAARGVSRSRRWVPAQPRDRPSTGGWRSRPPLRSRPVLPSPRRALDGPDHGKREAPHAQYRIAEHPGLRAYLGRPGHHPLER